MSLTEQFGVAALVASSAASRIASSPSEHWTGALLPATFSSTTGLAHDSADHSEIAVGSWGDGTIHRYRQGGVQ